MAREVIAQVTTFHRHIISTIYRCRQ